MILVDTSVWIDHLHRAEPELVRNLNTGNVLMHSMVIGEVACGNLPNRTGTLQRLNVLPGIDELDNDEVLSLIEERELMERGIGLVDAHLVGSVLNHIDAVLWTRDKRLRRVAEDLEIAYPEKRP